MTRLRSLFSLAKRRPVIAGFAAGTMALLVLSVATGMTTAVSADFTLAHWQFYKQVTLPPGVEQGQLVELTLDREVFLESNPWETDLRLVAGIDQEIPYQLAVLQKREQRESVPVEVRDLGYVEGEYSSLVTDVGGSGSLHSQVEIETAAAAENFRRNVVVETSNDGDTWAVVREDGEILDFTPTDREFRFHHTTVKYPQSAARYLRVKVLNTGEPPLDISGASVFLAEEVAARETEYMPVSASVAPAEDGTTYHQVDLGHDGIPVSRLSFQADTSNFFRRADIEGSDDGEDWRWLAGGELHSFDTPKFRGSNLEIEYPESRYRYYRLGVADGDNVPLSLTGYTLHGADRLLRFQVDAGSEYALYYGNPVAEAPDYDLQQVVPYLETEDLPVAALGGQQPNKAFTGLDVPVTERLPWLMPVGVALAAVVLAALLYGVIRQAKKVLPPPGGEPSS